MSQKLKVWWIPQIQMPGKPFEVYVESVTEGARLLNILADYDSFQYQNNIKPDYCNTGGLMMLDDDNEWVDWYYEGSEYFDDPEEYLRWTMKMFPDHQPVKDNRP